MTKSIQPRNFLIGSKNLSRARGSSSTIVWSSRNSNDRGKPRRLEFALRRHPVPKPCRPRRLVPASEGEAVQHTFRRSQAVHREKIGSGTRGTDGLCALFLRRGVYLRRDLPDSRRGNAPLEFRAPASAGPSISRLMCAASPANW